MDMQTVYKALPRDLFDDILTRFKRRQFHKLDCMLEYMEDNEPRRSGRSRSHRRWYEFLASNEELEGEKYEIAKRQRKLGYRMDNLLEDMKYMFNPRSPRSSFRNIGDIEDANSQEWMKFMQPYHELEDDEDALSPDYDYEWWLHQYLYTVAPPTGEDNEYVEDSDED
jgi:hypothetical protein